MFELTIRLIIIIIFVLIILANVTAFFGYHITTPLGSLDEVVNPGESLEDAFIRAVRR